MRNRKLYPLTKLLSQQDRDRFSLYLDSPLFNTRPSLNLFWSLWQERVLDAPGGEALEVTEVLAGSSLKASRFDRLCSQLYPKLREFMAMMQLEKKVELQQVLFSEALLERDPGQRSGKRILNEMEKSLEQAPESPEKYLGQIYFHLSKVHALIGSRAIEPGMHHVFREIQVWVERYAESKNLQLSCALNNISQIIRQDGELAASPVEISKLLVPPKEPAPALAKAYHLVGTLQVGHDSDRVFRELLQHQEREGEKIAPHLRAEIYSFVLNHCIRQVNLGNADFLDYAVQLYVHLLGQGLLLEKGKLPVQRFKNMVALGCRAGKLEWVEQLIRRYGEQLSDDHLGMAQTYNLAILRFHQARFQESIHLLQEVIQQPQLDLFYGLDARGYLWKAFFESRAKLNPSGVEAMYRLYDSMRLYVDRNKKISALHKVQYRSFVRLFKRFLHILETSDGSDQLLELTAFQEELAEAGPLPNKTWFSQKLLEAIAHHSS